LGNWEASISRCDPNTELRGLNETPDVIDKPAGCTAGWAGVEGGEIRKYGLIRSLLWPKLRDSLP